MKIVWFRLTPYRVPADRGITTRLHRIAAPTLALGGDEDCANPVVRAAEWQGRIRGAELQLSSVPVATC